MMGFQPKFSTLNRAASFEYLPAGTITPKIGLALTQTAGKLAVASGTTKPTYICACEKDAACTAGDIIPVIRVLPDMVFETQLQAAGTEVNLGDKLTIHTDGMQVTNTKTGGVAEVVRMDGTAVGDSVEVRF